MHTTHRPGPFVRRLGLSYVRRSSSSPMAASKPTDDCFGLHDRTTSMLAPAVYAMHGPWLFPSLLIPPTLPSLCDTLLTTLAQLASLAGCTHRSLIDELVPVVRSIRDRLVAQVALARNKDDGYRRPADVSDFLDPLRVSLLHLAGSSFAALQVAERLAANSTWDGQWRW